VEEAEEEEEGEEKEEEEEDEGAESAATSPKTSDELRIVGSICFGILKVSSISSSQFSVSKFIKRVRDAFVTSVA